MKDDFPNELPIMTDEQVNTAYTQVKCKINMLHIPNLTAADFQDLVEKAMDYILKYWGKFDSSRASWKTYMAVLARNAARYALHWYRRQRRIEFIELPESIEIQTIDSDVFRIIDDALGSETMAAKVARLRVRGFKKEEIRRLLGLSYFRYGKILNEIRKALKGK